MSQRIVFLGAGMMGTTLIAGLIAGGHSPGDLTAIVRRPQHRVDLEETYGIAATSDLDPVSQADLVVIGVKPHDVAGVAAAIAGLLRPETVVISVAAGITTAQLEEQLPAGQPVIRVMPNTPAQVGAGAAGVAAGSHATIEQTEQAQQLMQTVGTALIVGEKYLDAVGAISGSAPAYIFLVAEALIDAGVTLGLPRPVATELGLQTIAGAGKLLRESGTHPALLREQVTSPGGTTAAALGQLEEYKLRAAFLAATRAAAERSEQLGR